MVAPSAHTIAPISEELRLGSPRYLVIRSVLAKSGAHVFLTVKLQQLAILLKLANGLAARFDQKIPDYQNEIVVKLRPVI